MLTLALLDANGATIELLSALPVLTATKSGAQQRAKSAATTGHDRPEMACVKWQRSQKRTANERDSPASRPCAPVRMCVCRQGVEGDGAHHGDGFDSGATIVAEWSVPQPHMSLVPTDPEDPKIVGTVTETRTYVDSVGMRLRVLWQKKGRSPEPPRWAFMHAEMTVFDFAKVEPPELRRCLGRSVMHESAARVYEEVRKLRRLDARIDWYGGAEPEKLCRARGVNYADVRPADLSLKKARADRRTKHLRPIQLVDENVREAAGLGTPLWRSTDDDAQQLQLQLQDRQAGEAQARAELEAEISRRLSAS